MTYPTIIQGGMGVAVSSWRLANAVAAYGQLGVVSGTAMDLVLVRRLQVGDIGGHMRRALDAFPFREMAERVWDRYFVPEGKTQEEAFKSKPVPMITPGRALTELTVIANFVEVFLAKAGHNGLVGINLLEKIQLPTLPSLYGAMLAKVDFVLMGAGIPRHIPAALDRLSEAQQASIPINVHGALPGETYESTFDPTPFLLDGDGRLPRPQFLAIVSSSTLAENLLKKCSGKVNGFVVEGPTAGGHNAPPRGAMTLNELGEPIYGPRDVADLAAFRELGAPFWLAGSYGCPERYQEALNEGASGIQVGTAFAYCRESGIRDDLKAAVIQKVLRGDIQIKTDALASPTGFPFKVVDMPETMSREEVMCKRNRICDLGYLRQPYRTDEGRVGYRCASEPIDDFIAKGGELEQTVGRKCICNGLMSTIGLGQVRKETGTEPPIITSGDELVSIGKFIAPGETSYSAQDVIDTLMGRRNNGEARVLSATTSP